MALYMCIMTELSNLRLIPELMCFLFKAGDDYLTHVMETGNALRMRDGYVMSFLKPLYNFHCGQNNRIINGKLAKREADHATVIG